MKLSDKTLSLLKNFSTINQSLLFKQGNRLRTISVMKNILAEVTIEEELPKDFGIYDLSQFLNGIGNLIMIQNWILLMMAMWLLKKERCVLSTSLQTLM